jgi:hypothetical protein
MHRRDFLTKGTMAAGLVASPKMLEPLAGAKDKDFPPLGKRRLGKDKLRTRVWSATRRLVVM